MALMEIKPETVKKLTYPALAAVAAAALTSCQQQWVQGGIAPVPYTAENGRK